MRIRYYKWIFLSVFVLLASCRRDLLEEGGGEARTAIVNMVVSTRGATASDTDIAVNRIRLMVATCSSGGISVNRLSESPGSTTGFSVRARTGENNFYVIINETPEMTVALNKLSTVNDIENFRVNYQSSKVGDAQIMFGKRERVKVIAKETDTEAKVTYPDDSGVTQTEQSTLPLTAQRINARFSLTFIKNSDVFTVKNINFRVQRIPVYSFLGGAQTYPGTEWSDETMAQSSTATLTDNNTAAWDASAGEYKFGNGDKVTFDDFYLPEHLLTEEHRGNVDYSTVLIVNGTCVMVGGREQDANWRIDLMTNDFRISRNTHYKIAARIEGMGAMGLSTEILPVIEHEIPVNWGAPDGLAIVSDRESDYGKNVNVANDITAYSGILKMVKTVDGTETYSDVLFKYGSVIGLSTQAGGSGNNYSATDVVYDPALNGKTYSLASWTDIPSSTVDIAEVKNTLTGLRAGTGDPCQLIGVTARQMELGRYGNGLWHTATADELNLLIENGDHQADGTSYADSRGLAAYHSLLIPVTAHRNKSGVLSPATNWGYYLSGQSGQVLTFDASSPSSSSITSPADNTQSAYTVRCVRNTIPEAVLKTKSTSVSYKGGSFTIDVTSNIPYWTAELITSINNNGDVANVGDQTGVNFTKMAGAFDGVVSGTLEPRMEKTDNQFYIRFIGTGYDGKEVKQIVGIIQRGYAWSLSILSNTLASTIPAAGGTYRAVVKLSPADVPFPSGGVECTLTTQINGVAQANPLKVKFDADSRTATFDYTVPANAATVSRMISLVFSTTQQCSVTTSQMQSKATP